MTARFDLFVVGSGFFGLTIAERAGHAARQAGPRRRATAAHRRQRVLGARTADRDRGAQVRRAPVPHLQQAGVGVRQPVHRLHRLPAPGVRDAQRAGVPVPDGPGPGVAVLRPLLLPGRGARADRRAGVRDRDRRSAEPRGEGDLADRPAAVRGVRQGLHRKSSGRPTPRSCPRASSPGCRCATRSTTATSTTPTRACRSTGTPHGCRTWPPTSASRCAWTPTGSTCATSCGRPARTRRWSTPDRWTATSTTPKAD